MSKKQKIEYDPIKSELNHDFFASNGLVCELRRHPQMLHLCGYVYIPSGHPYFQKSYEELDVNVHGGLTFSRLDNTNREWIVGFDCAHCDDLVPATATIYKELNIGTYRDWDYVKKEIENLAWQISLVSSEEERKEYEETIDYRLAKKVLEL